MSTSFYWKGKVKVDGSTHLFTWFAAAGTASRYQMSLCGRRPKDKGPSLDSGHTSVNCRGCKTQYSARTGREWNEPPPAAR